MILYRAVSEEELADLIATGVFRSPPGTLEVKWFAESRDHAAEWAQRFAAADGKMYTVVEVEIPDPPPARSQRRLRQDGIGPAWWLDLDQLSGATFREVSL